MMSSDNFFLRIFGSLFASNDPKAIKIRNLKRIAKDISRSRFGKWYKPSTKDLTPQCAKFFFEIYKTLGPAQALLAGMSSSNAIKSIIVEHNLTDEQKKIIERLSAEKIKEKSESTPPNALAGEINQNLKLLYRSFSATQNGKINTTFEHLDVFINFVLFDYYYLLKKFDFNFQEGNFKYSPNFKNAIGAHLSETLKDFATVFAVFPFDANWNDIFTIIYKYKNIKSVNPTAWKKLYSTLIEVKRSNVIKLIIAHIDSNPNFNIIAKPAPAQITKEFVTKITKTAEATLKSIMRAKRDDKVEILIKGVFGTNMPTSGTKYYTTECSSEFVKKGLQGFSYAKPLSYLKSFLIEYFKTEIRTLSDLFLVRATWESKTSVQAYSESYHELLKVVEKIIEFDENLKLGDPLAMKLKANLGKMDRDKASGRYLARQLEELNSYAHKIIMISLKHLTIIANNFKAIMEDYDRPRRTLIQNWKEIEINSQKPPREWLENAYKKIGRFITLLQLYSPSKSH
ncbi:MAG: hypothetical protein CR988_04025 [Treponema sp.]|nr:MAG: hypothetical protein CR988_04025 [Treponema sp.]